MVKEILLTQGKVALVDDEDYEWLNKMKWYAHLQSGIFYAMRHTPKTKTKTRGLVGMHRFIMNPPSNLGVDHIDGNGLNNQKSNLRIATTRENQQNQHRPKTSAFPGVHKRGNQWVAQTQMNGIHIHLGIFKTEEDAAERYRSQVDRILKGLKVTKIKSSKYKGVSFNKRTKKWEAFITANKKTKYIGLFESEEDAHNRRKAIEKIFSDWCVIDA